MSSLTIKAYRAVCLVVAVMAVLLFAAAGSLDYWQAWTFLAVYFAASLAVTFDLAKRDPELLERRMGGGPFAEKEPAQKIIMSLTSLGFIALLIVPALDRRLAWSHMPPYMALIGDAMVAFGFLAVFFVFRANTFTSATIELAPEQRVVSTGPYALVRHPMYVGGLVLLAGVPLALGSWWGLLVVAAMVPALIWRLIDEEQFLARNLAGYRAYQQQVRYRLVPGVW
jgi:protein-S-isoprenylcysteine O-methyltransferase Ste14